MKKIMRIAILCIVVISIAFVKPVSAESTDPVPATWFTTTILDAGYLDIDGDGMADDIATSFKIEVMNTDIPFSITDILCYLITPSGDGYAVQITVIGHYKCIQIGLAWYNTVTESGWYTFMVYTEITVYHQHYYSYDELSFDPPTEGNPGPPLVEVTETIVETE